jgi:ethanolamine utilization protein EutM
MAKQAIGLLETRGLCCLVTGIDAALKAANVQLTGPMKNVGSGLCNAVITGDVAAVKAAIDTAADTAAQLGEVVSAHVIARPDDAIEKIIPAVKKAPARK